MSIPANVQRGAEFLDAELGPYWDEDIIIGRLDLGDTCNCVVGQLMRSEVPRHRAYQRYDRGVEKFGIKSPARLGFNTWGRQTFGRLTEAWRDLISDRREARRRTA